MGHCLTGAHRPTSEGQQGFVITSIQESQNLVGPAQRYVLKT